MKVWEYKSYRCEWQIISQPIDQYGDDNGYATVLAAWPTFEDAIAIANCDRIWLTPVEKSVTVLGDMNNHPEVEALLLGV